MDGQDSSQIPVPVAGWATWIVPVPGKLPRFPLAPQSHGIVWPWPGQPISKVEAAAARSIHPQKGQKCKDVVGASGRCGYREFAGASDPSSAVGSCQQPSQELGLDTPDNLQTLPMAAETPSLVHPRDDG
ncbi:hypothetical protein CPAR01_10375 [Colletotrichum paranaense]|uniref:Uncharacterized protein n=1 Tax=Colletotrichum paranaense TaxID=1914294 RepID=A0ABQ9SDU4_9PEZI|nr:uncharacterized protein CPAR01_10375 [Colletotrichum paranaense]KAK1533667.1 hypothetical protein CPAR01_10375 [Colletotrichum paranaense]